jgi:hypothetical protein
MMLVDVSAHRPGHLRDADLDAAAERLQAELGLLAVGGGRHDGLGTRNRIVPLGDGSFLELLGCRSPSPSRVCRFFIERDATRVTPGAEHQLDRSSR